MALPINDTAAFRQYTATAGQTVFAVPFEFFANTDLKVYRNSTLIAYDATPATVGEYSVTGANTDGGGSITLGAGATLDDTITIVRDVPVARTTDFPTSGPFQVDSLNTDLDKAIAMIAQQETKIDQRVLRLADFDTPSTLDALPAKAVRASKFLGFDSDGQPTVLSATDGEAGSLAVALASTASGEGAELVGVGYGGTDPVAVDVLEALLVHGIPISAYGSNQTALTNALARANTLGVPLIIDQDCALTAAATLPTGGDVKIVCVPGVVIAGASIGGHALFSGVGCSVEVHGGLFKTCSKAFNLESSAAAYTALRWVFHGSRFEDYQHGVYIDGTQHSTTRLKNFAFHGCYFSARKSGGTHQSYDVFQRTNSCPIDLFEYRGCTGENGGAEGIRLDLASGTGVNVLAVVDGSAWDTYTNNLTVGDADSHFIFNRTGLTKVTNCRFENLTPASASYDASDTEALRGGCDWFVDNCTFLDAGAGEAILAFKGSNSVQIGRIRIVNTDAYNTLIASTAGARTDSTGILAPAGRLSFDFIYMENLTGAALDFQSTDNGVTVRGGTLVCKDCLFKSYSGTAVIRHSGGSTTPHDIEMVLQVEGTVKLANYIVYSQGGGFSLRLKRGSILRSDDMVCNLTTSPAVGEFIVDADIDATNMTRIFEGGSPVIGRFEWRGRLRNFSAVTSANITATGFLDMCARADIDVTCEFDGWNGHAVNWWAFYLPTNSGIQIKQDAAIYDETAADFAGLTHEITGRCVAGTASIINETATIRQAAAVFAVPVSTAGSNNINIETIRSTASNLYNINTRIRALMVAA